MRRRRSEIVPISGAATTSAARAWLVVGGVRAEMLVEPGESAERAAERIAVELRRRGVRARADGAKVLGAPVAPGRAGGFSDRAALLRAVLEECSPITAATAEERATAMLHWVLVWGPSAGLPLPRGPMPELLPGLMTSVRRRAAALRERPGALAPGPVLVDILRAYGLGPAESEAAVRLVVEGSGLR